MSYLFAMVIATAVSLAIIPVMVRLAPTLGMLDHPDPRKVHQRPIPRVGGWGIVLGALVPILVLLPHNAIVLSYAFGVSTLFLFGSLDDHREMGHYTKFIGQFIAVIPVVFAADLTITYVPLFGDGHIPAGLSQLITITSLIGMINAVNHSDGLDGLAGGETLLSLLAFAFLGYLAGSGLIIILTFAAIGGGIGFLRYNTHPATVFMGDGGSQFLGFTIGFIAILLTQHVDTTISPAAMLLILGLPIADILVVLFKRIHAKRNWFLATKNHIHHRLLDIGFSHQESVVIIYAVQALFVITGVLLRFENNWLLLLLYLGMSTAVFISLSLAEKYRWGILAPSDARPLDQVLNKIRNRYLVVAPRKFLDFGVPLYLIVASLTVRSVPSDFSMLAAGIFLLLVIEVLFNNILRSITFRSLVYAIVAFIIYLQHNYPPVELAWFGVLEFMLFLLMAVAVYIAVKFSPRRRKYEFHATAMDYLMMIIISTTLLVSYQYLDVQQITLFVIKVIIMLYACELLVIEKRERWNILTYASLIASATLALRGVLSA